MSFETIDIAEAQSLIENQQVTIIDIRDPASYASGHIDNAIHIDNSNLEAFIEDADKAIPLIVCCYHGNMSKGAADFFNGRGFAQSFSLNGGYTQWAQDQSPE